MHEHNGWSFISLIAHRGKVSIKHQVLLFLSFGVIGGTILDIFNDLYLVFRKDRVNEAARTYIVLFFRVFISLIFAAYPPINNLAFSDCIIFQVVNKVIFFFYYIIFT